MSLQLYRFQSLRHIVFLKLFTNIFEDNSRIKIHLKDTGVVS